MSSKYEDILHLPRPVSTRRSRMTNYDRAAQFSPFAALTGFDAAIAETARLTDKRIELDEGSREELDAALRQLQEQLPRQPRVTATYFVYDPRKAGGAYVCVSGHTRKIDLYMGTLILQEGDVIPLREIIRLTME